jgi:hypothetical protein
MFGASQLNKSRAPTPVMRPAYNSGLSVPLLLHPRNIAIYAAPPIATPATVLMFATLRDI